MLIGGEWAFHTPFLCGMVLGSILSPLLFTIYMKPLGEVICQFRFWYQQYAGDIHLYPSAVDQPDKAAEILSQWMEYGFGWQRTVSVSILPKPRSCGCLECLDLEMFWLWPWMGWHFPIQGWCIIWGSFLDSQLLYDEHMAPVAPFPRLGVAGFRKSFMP